MRWQRAALLALLSIVVLAGCVTFVVPLGEVPHYSGGKVDTVRLKVDPVKDGKGNLIGVKIDQSHHDSGVVEPGDRIVWVCDCPEGAEFAVEKLHFAGDLDKLVDVLSRTGDDGRSELDRLGQALESLQRSLPAPQGQEMVADKLWDQEAKPEGDRQLLGFTAVALQNLRETLVPEQSHPLFENWSPPSRFVRARETIRSAPVAQGIGHELWKFTWKVRVKGHPKSESSRSPT